MNMMISYQELVRTFLIEAPDGTDFSMFSAISQKTGLSNVTPILGTSDNGNGTNLAIIGFNSEPDKSSQYGGQFC